MIPNVRDELLMCLRRAAMATFAIGAIAVTVHASPPGSEEYHSAFAVAGPTTDAPRAADFGPIDTVLSYELNRMFDVKQVRAQRMRTDTGTTLMPTENGFYEIRCPALGSIHQVMETAPN